MPVPGFVDHILIALSVLFDPFYGVWVYRRLVQRVRAGVANARATVYRQAMLLYWTFTIGLLAFWFGSDRPAAALGLAAPEGLPLLVGSIVTAAGLAVLYAQWIAVAKMDAKALEPLRAQMESFAEILPRTERESAHFRLLSFTAGVCEEIICRGYMIWYLTAFVGEWPAVFVAALVFGVGHLYQGSAGVIKTAVSGFLLGILYVYTDSLLFPVILHVAVDLQGGAMARRVLGSAAISADISVRTPPSAGR